MISLFNAGPETGPLLILAHGAGAPATSPFMTLMAELLAGREIGSARFEFAYMAERRTGGKRRPPPRAETLKAEYVAAVDAVAAANSGRALFIGGKSMGGRVASMVADDLLAAGKVRGLVCLGYPFHPPAKPENLRTPHLLALRCPALIVQGERDPFGSRTEVEGYALSAAIRLHWASDGDHDLGPRGGKGFTRRGNLAAAADTIAAFVAAHAQE